MLKKHLFIPYKGDIINMGTKTQADLIFLEFKFKKLNFLYLI